MSEYYELQKELDYLDDQLDNDYSFNLITEKEYKRRNRVIVNKRNKLMKLAIKENINDS
tara:strand:- start:397 stop:573 length:177 start_codon:yes stop_codon:yes gene_type:complete